MFIKYVLIKNIINFRSYVVDIRYQSLVEYLEKNFSVIAEEYAEMNHDNISEEYQKKDLDELRDTTSAMLRIYIDALKTDETSEIKSYITEIANRRLGQYFRGEDVLQAINNLKIILITKIFSDINSVEDRLAFTLKVVEMIDLAVTFFVSAIQNYRLDEVKELESMKSKLQVSSRNSRDILSTISNIAKNSKVLAINASVEAARAGKYGKGFKVVAHEIAKMSDGIQTAVNQAFQLMKQ